jgi:hypothetical protein
MGFPLSVLSSRRPPVSDRHLRRLEFRRRRAWVTGTGPVAWVGTIARREFLDIASTRPHPGLWGVAVWPQVVVATTVSTRIASPVGATPVPRIGDRCAQTGTTKQQESGNETDSRREAWVRSGHSSSPTGGKDRSMSCAMHSYMPTQGLPGVFGEHAKLSRASALPVLDVGPQPVDRPVPAL